VTRVLLAAVIFGFCIPTGAEEPPHLSRAQIDYLERCGGCHGIEGVSAQELVPTLRHRAGYFLCTRLAREYLVRLPSVATSPLSDEAVANLMNFVVFDIGDAPNLAPNAQTFSAAEVHLLRRNPLNEVALSAYRSGVIEDLIRRCGAPPALRDYRPSAAPATGAR
jgi:cytochrome c553